MVSDSSHDEQFPLFGSKQPLTNLDELLNALPSHSSSTIRDLLKDPDEAVTLEDFLSKARVEEKLETRKRPLGLEVLIEKTVERRQKRMMMNRESAARSRARKQAYTHELEIKVSRLEEENERLRQELEGQVKFPPHEIKEMFSASTSPANPRNKLQRTNSASF